MVSQWVKAEKGTGRQMEGQNTFLHADKAVLNQIEETMPPEEELQDLAEFFKVFGDATRLKILYVLLHLVLLEIK